MSDRIPPFKAHRGRLAPNDAAFIRSHRANQNIWWSTRKWYWLAVVLAWVMNKTEAMGDE